MKVVKNKKPPCERKKPEEKQEGNEKIVEAEGKSKVELKAERRAKQEAQRASKLAQQQKPAKPDTVPEKAKAVDNKKVKYNSIMYRYLE